MRVLPTPVPGSSLLPFCIALLLCSCGGEPATTTTTGAAGSSGAAGTGGVAGTGGAAGSSAGGGGEGGSILSGVGGGAGTGMTPVRKITNLKSITFWERTGGSAPDAYEFTVDGPELTVRSPDPLAPDTSDIVGASTEYYDVYYSNEDGTFNLDGSYLTISGSYLFAMPAGGGLNLAEIGLNYSGAPTEYGNYVASYVALGDNKVEASVNNCVDGDLQTHTTMGNTLNAPDPSDRLRLTLGFLSSSGEPK